MAYTRGEYYLWTDENEGEEWLHIWSAIGYDDWDLAEWACDEDGKRHEGMEEASGTSLPLRVIDEFVVTRLAELIYDGQVEGVIDRALPNARGSGAIGGRLLRKNVNVERLKAALRQIKLDPPDPL